VLVHLHRHRLVVQRTHRRVLVERVAEQDSLHDAAAEPLDVFVVHRSVNHDPLAGRAALAGAQKARGQRRLDRRRHIAVF
jgi:hypothetical protein